MLCWQSHVSYPAPRLSTWVQHLQLIATRLPVSKENSITLYSTLGWSNKVFARARSLFFSFIFLVTLSLPLYFFSLSFIVLVGFSPSVSQTHDSPVGVRTFKGAPVWATARMCNCKSVCADEWCAWWIWRELWRLHQLLVKLLMFVSCVSVKSLFPLSHSVPLCVCVCLCSLALPESELHYLLPTGSYSSMSNSLFSACPLLGRNHVFCFNKSTV